MDFFQIVQNVVEMIPAWGLLLRWISHITGIVFGIMALLMIQKRVINSKADIEWKVPLWTFFIGVTLIMLPLFLVDTSQSVFADPGSDPQRIFELTPGTLGQIEGAQARELITGIVAFVQFVGIITIFRSLLTFRHAGEGNKNVTFGMATVMLLAGIAMWNLPMFMQAIENVFVTNAG